MINDEYELCFVGQLDSISPQDVDFYVTARVTDFVNTKGTYSLQAACPEDYYGEQYLEWELTSGLYDVWYGEGANYYKAPFTLEELSLVGDKYSSLISSELWDIIASEQAEEAYDKYDSGRYDYQT